MSKNEIIGELSGLEREALLLEDALIAVITGNDIESRFFARQDEIWGEGPKEFVVQTDDVDAVFDRNSLRYSFGTGYGKISGIYPFIDIEDRTLNNQSTVELTVSDEGAPNFTILPVVIGVVATRQLTLS